MPCYSLFHLSGLPVTNIANVSKIHWKIKQANSDIGIPVHASQLHPNRLCQNLVPQNARTCAIAVPSMQKQGGWYRQKPYSKLLWYQEMAKARLQVPNSTDRLNLIKPDNFFKFPDWDFSCINKNPNRVNVTIALGMTVFLSWHICGVTCFPTLVLVLWLSVRHSRKAHW